MLYLKNHKNLRESSREFVSLSRQIVMTKISIDDKKTENERLLDYITMEQEKLEQKRREIEEDRERYEKIVNDADKQDKKIQEELKAAVREKITLAREIEAINQELQQKDN